MANTYLTAKDFTASYGGATFKNIKSFTIDETREAIASDVTGTDAIYHIAGHYTWTATVSCAVDDSTGMEGDPVGNSTSAELIIQVQESPLHKFSGQAVNTGASVSTSVNGEVLVTYSFKGDGAITESLAAS